MQLGGDARYATGKDLARIRSELGQEVRVQEIDLVNGNVVAAARHLPVATAKTNAAFYSLGFSGHNIKSDLPNARLPISAFHGEVCAS